VEDELRSGGEVGKTKDYDARRRRLRISVLVSLGSAPTLTTLATDNFHKIKQAFRSSTAVLETSQRRAVER